MAQTLFDKLWQAHRVADIDDTSALIWIDRIFLHERTGSIALNSIKDAGHAVRTPAQAFGIMDHIVDTFPGRTDDTKVSGGKNYIITHREACTEAGLKLFDLGDPAQGIAHVVSPEQGLALPGLTVVCPDSHTCTLGGLGALAWGIGSTEGEHALATQTLTIARPKTMRVRFDGKLGAGVTAKDMILHLIGQYTAAGGSGYAVEFAGEAVEALEVEARLTLCNMAVEFSAFTGLVAPDNKTIAYVTGRPYAPEGAALEAAIQYWKTLHSDEGARFDKDIVIDACAIAPTVTWGTSPGHAVAVTSSVPAAADAGDETAARSWQRALDYMGLEAGTSLAGLAIDAAFIGSCTNARISDLRAAAAVLKGRKVKAGVKAICVPGSQLVKAAAEAEGLDRVFTDAGFEWRESGCSMCFFAGGESFGARERVISSTNRNFESRQGKDTRTHLASPAMVAAAAVAGAIADVRDYPEL